MNLKIANGKKQLYLTSSKIDGLLALLPRSPQKTRLAFIPTAADPYEDKWFMEADRKKLGDLGFQMREVDLKNINKEELRKKLRGVDAVYIAGGNTFYLLEKVQQSGFDEVIKELVEKGVVYAGSSAGAVIAGPTIEPVSVFDDRRAAPSLTSMEGLKLVDFIVLPHYQTDGEHKVQHENVIATWSKKGYTIVPITNDQAIRVTGNEHTVINLSHSKE